MLSGPDRQQLHQQGPDASESCRLGIKRPGRGKPSLSLSSISLASVALPTAKLRSTRLRVEPQNLVRGANLPEAASHLGQCVTGAACAMSESR